MGTASDGRGLSAGYPTGTGISARRAPAMTGLMDSPASGKHPQIRHLRRYSEGVFQHSNKPLRPHPALR